MDETKIIKYWYVVTWINEKIDKDFPKFHSIFGSDEKGQDENYIFDYDKKDFILHYTCKLLHYNRKKLSLKELKPILSEKFNEHKRKLR